MSFLALVRRCMAMNHLVSGVFALWKIVPAFTDVCTQPAEHRKTRRSRS